MPPPTHRFNVFFSVTARTVIHESDPRENEPHEVWVRAIDQAVAFDMSNTNA